MGDLVQSPPSTPPSHNSTHCQVFVFGDLAISFEQDLRQLLHVKDNGSLHSFFNQVAFAFRQEIASLPASVQEWFPRFTTLIDVLANFDELEGAPALRFALLSVYQLGRFVRFFAEGSTPFPNASTTYLLGLCTGSFAAAAISTAQTVAELIPAGVEAVLVAFRTALRSLQVQRDVEKPVPGDSQSWSVAVSLTEAQASDLVEKFAADNSLARSSRPYISAITPTTVTISGPPSLLKALVDSSSIKAHHLPIHSPYHGSHLFGTDDVDEILGELRDKRLETYKPRIPLLSPVSGSIIVAGDFRALLHRAVTDALCEQVRWERILETCAKEVFHGTAFEACTIWPVASNAAPLLSSVLTRATKLSVLSNLTLNTGIEAIQPPRPTGKFEDSKIAIIGFSGRFPEAASNEEFWELLRAGRDVHRTIPKDRFDWEAHFDPTGKKKNTSRVKYGCFINEPGLFDARFFNLSPREAENTDPAQRLALMATYEALEMAGLVPNRTPSTQQDRIGVFFGVTSDDWREVNSAQNVDTYFVPGGNRAFVPGRIRQVPIPYYFRFSGPSLSIDTACSSSFAAIQTACTQLWRGDCDTAVAGGTNVLTNPDNFAGLDRGHFLSTTGNCNAFDDGASGYCRADAVGAVILKRLEDAEADNDPIFGVIAGSNTNHSGQTESITRPHEGDQASVFKRIIRYANVDPRHVSYIEMHGTGTQAGDATEMKSVLSVFVPGQERMPRHPLYLGSVKANVGHAESASGVSSLIKVLMMMQHDEIPPHCGIKTKINHNYPLDLEERTVNIAFKPTAWRRADCVGEKRIVFLNNFSAAGGNTALLLEDAPIARCENDGRDPRTSHLVTVTARGPKSLKANVEALIAHLERNPDISLPALSYTTTARRLHSSHRITCTGTDISSIKGALKTRVASTDSVKPIPTGKDASKVVFVFTGQGSLYTGIGQQLFESISYFRTDILHFDRLGQRQGFPSFLPLVDGSATADEEPETIIAHLALACVQMALSRLWTSWGVVPSATVGHSLGEYAALFAAGVLTASDTIYLVGTRAQLLSKHCTKSTHSMLAVKAPLGAITPRLIGSSCDIACINQPASHVISGPNHEISRLAEEFRSLGHECVKLGIPYAFHSAQVEPVLDHFEAAARAVRFNTPSIPYMSPLLSRIVTDAGILGPSYLSRACRNAVNFQGAIEGAMTSGVVNERTIWLEIGSHPACSGMIKGTLGSQTVALPSLRKDTDTWRVLTGTLESLYLRGIEIQWNEYHRDFQSSHICLALPRYSWDLKNYWIQYRNNFCLTKGDNPPVPQQTTTVSATSAAPAPVFISPSVQRVLQEYSAADVSSLLVESDINDPRLAPVFQGHKVNGVCLCSSSVYADMALTITQYMLTANDMWTETTGLDCGDVKVDRSLIASFNGSPQLLRASASADWSKETVSLSFFGVNAHSQKTVDYAKCLVKITSNQTWIEDWKRSSYLIKSRISALHHGVDWGNSHKMKRGMVYKLFSSLVDYDARYQGMQEVVLDSSELEATAQVTFQVGDEGFYNNPCWIDSLGHLAGFIMNGNDNIHSKDQVFINHGWDRMRCATKLECGKTYQTYNRMQLASGTMYIGDTYILEDGRVVAIYEGVKFQGVNRRVLDHLLPSKTGTTSAEKRQLSSVVKTTSKLGQLPVVSAASHSNTVVATTKPMAVSRSRVTEKIEGNNDIVKKVMSVIAEEARVDLAELGLSTSFTDHGIDSLLSLTIAGRLQEELRLDVSSADFMEFPTVEEFAIHIGGTEVVVPTPEGLEPIPASSSTSSGLGTPDNMDSSSEGYKTDATSVDGNIDVMDAIRSTIAQETGFTLNDLTPSTKFSELGVDSLLALTVMGALSEVLEVELPPSLLIENDTLHDVENTLRMNGFLGKKINEPMKAAQEHDATIVAPKTLQFQLDGPPHATSILLQGSAKTAKKTLFLFPDGSGSATSYASIPHISPDIVVYGLNCPWMKTPEDLKCSLNQYAAKYMTEIRRRQAKGPYYFGGWSAGGIIAYEVAQQLTSTGEETARLILIDSPNPIGLENPPQRMYDFFESLDFFGMGGKTPPSWLRPHFNAFISMLDDYKVRPFSGGALKTHIIYARDGICKNPEDPRPEIRADDPREMLWLLNNRTDFSASGWKALVGERNVTVDVMDEVNHFSMVAPGPKAKDLSSFIAKAML